MPRKQKDIYARIEDKETQIEELKRKLELREKELQQLNKEKEMLEMKRIFDSAKEHNLTVQQIIEMISSRNK